MKERIGLVVNVFADHTAEVMTDKKSACGGCEDSRDCKSCLSGGDKVIAVVRNEPRARPGDFVVIAHTKAAIWSSAALFYLFPVVGLMIGAFAGGALAGGWGVDESGAAAVFGLVGLGIALLAVVLFSRSKYAGSRLVPRITRIAEPGKREETPPGACCGGKDVPTYSG